MGESNPVLEPYLGVSDSADDDMYWSKSGNVWLRGRWVLTLVVAGKIGLAAAGGTKGDGAVPESGVKKGEVGLNGPGENDEGAVSVNALLSEFVLCEWNGPCLLPNSR